MAGPFDSDAPIALDIVQIMQGLQGIVLRGASEILASEILGKSMQMKC